MQRQTEMEKLFHWKLLRLARAEDVSNCTVTRVAKVEQDLVQQKEIVSVYEDAIDRFDICRARLEAQEQRLEDIEQRLEISKTHVSVAQKDITDLSRARCWQGDHQDRSRSQLRSRLRPERCRHALR